MISISRIQEKVEDYFGTRRSIKQGRSSVGVLGYRKTIDTQRYEIYEKGLGSDNVIAAYGDMVIVQDRKNKNKLTIYPYYLCRRIKRTVILDSKTFLGLLPHSRILLCQILPYMRVVAKDQYLKALRINIITDQAQIYHNFPARAMDCDGFSKPGDRYRFEESVVWDLPRRKYPSDKESCGETERFYPDLPRDCYQYHPIMNTDNSYHDLYRNGGFGKTTGVMVNGQSVAVSRFYIPCRTEQANPFHYIGTGKKNYKLNLLATYRSNIDVGVRTCIFASSDGGRQWFCKYEFADLGEYPFKQGHIDRYGRNFGNKIKNNHFDSLYREGISVIKRQLIIPGDNSKWPTEKFLWKDIGEVKSICDNEVVTLHMSKPHGLTTGNIIALKGNQNIAIPLRWMLNNEITSQSAGSGVLFKVDVKNETDISLYELVSSPDNNIPCRHIHHLNRIKDGWIIGTGEIYPNGWELYFQVKGADTFTPVSASDEFPIVRLNSTKNSIQRTMGAILFDDENCSMIYASDHDLLNRKENLHIDEGEISLSRNSTGVFCTSLKNIDNRDKQSLILEAEEPCFYFQRLDTMIVFCGQRGELFLSFDNFKNWNREELAFPIIHYFGSNRQFYYFDKCILFRK